MDGIRRAFQGNFFSGGPFPSLPVSLTAGARLGGDGGWVGLGGVGGFGPLSPSSISVLGPLSPSLFLLHQDYYYSKSVCAAPTFCAVRTKSIQYIIVIHIWRGFFYIANKKYSF